MSSRDFLHKNADTPLCEYYIAAGAICGLWTNSEEVLEAARGTFEALAAKPASPDFSIRLWIDTSDQARSSWPKPYVRGLDHLVFAGFDLASSFLADLRSRRVIGRFSAGMAMDTEYWKTVIFPIVMSIVAGSVGLVELHASCVASDEKGLILIGGTGSGKSTLALALTEAGFRFLSDDRTFCSSRDKTLFAWGMPRPLKLRREAARWFEEFRGREPTDIQNGERVFHYFPNRIKMCEPRALIFLERQQNLSYSLTEISGHEVRARIEADLLPEYQSAIQKQSAVIERLTTLPCFRLAFDGEPQVIVAKLAGDLPEFTTGLTARKGCSTRS